MAQIDDALIESATLRAIQYTVCESLQEVNNENNEDYKIVIVGGRAFDFYISNRLQSILAAHEFNGQPLYEKSFDYDLAVYPLRNNELHIARYDTSYLAKREHYMIDDGGIRDNHGQYIDMTIFPPFQALLQALKNKYNNTTDYGEVNRTNFIDSVRGIQGINIEQLRANLTSGDAFRTRAFIHRGSKAIWMIKLRIPGIAGYDNVDIDIIDMKNPIRNVQGGNHPRFYRVTGQDQDGYDIYAQHVNGDYVRTLERLGDGYYRYYHKRSYWNDRNGGANFNNVAIRAFPAAGNIGIYTYDNVWTVKPSILFNDNSALIGNTAERIQICAAHGHNYNTLITSLDEAFDMGPTVNPIVWGTEIMRPFISRMDADELESAMSEENNLKYYRKFIKRFVRIFCTAYMYFHCNLPAGVQELYTVPIQQALTLQNNPTKLITFFNIRLLKSIPHNYFPSFKINNQSYMKHGNGACQAADRKYPILYHLLQSRSIIYYQCPRNNSSITGTFSSCPQNAQVTQYATTLQSRLPTNLALVTNADIRNCTQAFRTGGAPFTDGPVNIQYIDIVDRWGWWGLDGHGIRFDQLESTTECHSIISRILRLCNNHAINLKDNMNQVINLTARVNPQGMAVIAQKYMQVCSLVRSIYHFTNTAAYRGYFQNGMTAYRYSPPMSVLLHGAQRRWSRLDVVNIGADIYIPSILSTTIRNHFYNEGLNNNEQDSLIDYLPGVRMAIEQQHTLYIFQLLNNEFLFMNQCAYVPDQMEIILAPGMRFRVIGKGYQTIASLPVPGTQEDPRNYRQVYCVTLQQINQDMAPPVAAAAQAAQAQAQAQAAQAQAAQAQAQAQAQAAAAQAAQVEHARLRALANAQAAAAQAAESERDRNARVAWESWAPRHEAEARIGRAIDVPRQATHYFRPQQLIQPEPSTYTANSYYRKIEELLNLIRQIALYHSECARRMMNVYEDIKDKMIHAGVVRNEYKPRYDVCIMELDGVISHMRHLFGQLFTDRTTYLQILGERGNLEPFIILLGNFNNIIYDLLQKIVHVLFSGYLDWTRINQRIVIGFPDWYKHIVGSESTYNYVCERGEFKFTGEQAMYADNSIPNYTYYSLTDNSNGASSGARSTGGGSFLDIIKGDGGEYRPYPDVPYDGLIIYPPIPSTKNSSKRSINRFMNRFTTRSKKNSSNNSSKKGGTIKKRHGKKMRRRY